MATISTHNGSTLSQKHNRRDRKVCDKEKHIRKDGEYEIWLDVDIKDAYKRIFEKARVEYNATQKRKDRKIDDYLDKIRQDKKKHVAYEMIIGVYGEDSTPQQKKEILWDFANDWKKRNPNLVMIGCYYHFDEEGKDPHLHIDYIPIAQCERGMSIQNSLDRAFMQQGIECGESIHETRQIMWQKRENKVLEQLCHDRGISVEHNPFYKGHESTSAYKQRQQRKELEKQKEIYNKNNNVLKKQKEIYLEQQKELEKMAQKVAFAQEKLERLKEEYIDESLGNLRQFATKEAIENKKRDLDL